MKLKLDSKINKTTAWIKVVDVETKSEIKMTITAKGTTVGGKIANVLPKPDEKKLLKIAEQLGDIFDEYYSIFELKTAMFETGEELMKIHKSITLK